MSRYLTSVAENAVGKHGRVHLARHPGRAGQPVRLHGQRLHGRCWSSLMPVVGAIADRTGRKRDIMLGFGWFGALACVAMVGVAGSNWQLGAVLYALAFLGYSCSIVVNYSLLVDLSTARRARPRVVGRLGDRLHRWRSAAALSLSCSACSCTTRRCWPGSRLCASGIWWAAVQRSGPGGCWPDSPRRTPAASAARLGDRGRFPPAAAARCAELRGYPLTLAFLIAFLDLQRRHPDRHHRRRPVRRQAAAPVRHRAAARPS